MSLKTPSAAARARAFRAALADLAAAAEAQRAAVRAAA